jgi:hypothetical protein
MVGLGDQLIGCIHKCVGLGLQVSPTTLLDFGLNNLVQSQNRVSEAWYK